MTIHHAAQQGYENESAAYQRGRPEYPEALLGWLTGELRIAARTRVLDLGAGTGKFTRLLAKTGAALTAVEPVEAMRAQLQQQLPEARALAGTAEHIPLAAGEVDVVVCAQAFHWFSNAQAVAEMHRVLAPGGRLGMVWNVRDEATDWVAEITRIITPYEGDAPRYYTGKWRQPFEHQTLFTPPAVTRLPHQHVGSFDQVVIDRFMSVSFIAALPDDEKHAVADQLRALKDRYPVLREATIAFPYVTEAWRCDRLG